MTRGEPESKPSTQTQHTNVEGYGATLERHKSKHVRCELAAPLLAAGLG